MSERKKTPMLPLKKHMARAIYESHQLKKPWDHPDTVRVWHESCERTAKAAIKAYHDWQRAQ